LAATKTPSSAASAYGKNHISFQRFSAIAKNHQFPSKKRLDKLAALHNHVVVQPYGYAMNASQQLDATFAALADPTRRAILARLATGEASVLELAEPFSMSQPAISKHLKVLERAGLTHNGGRDASKRSRWRKPTSGSNATAKSGKEISSGSTRCWKS
jgi:DNA-binding MarR family transcriptional regulator